MLPKSTLIKDFFDKNSWDLEISKHFHQRVRKRWSLISWLFNKQKIIQNALNYNNIIELSGSWHRQSFKIQNHNTILVGRIYPTKNKIVLLSTWMNK